MQDDSFKALVKKVRAGDEDAAADLVKLYEPEIRRIVRVRLTDARLRRTLDSMDICQSVLANFFMRVSAGQFELDTPEQLMGLLATMARNKLLDHTRKQQAAQRDVRKLQDGPEIMAAVSDDAETPSQIVAGRELLSEMRRRLTDEERRLAEQRALGREWDDIAQELGAKPDALRIKLTRAMNRVARELGLEEVS